MRGGSASARAPAGKSVGSKGAYAWRSLLGTGVIIAGGSDFPVESPNPVYGIYAAVARRLRTGEEHGWQPEQRMTREEAVLLHHAAARLLRWPRDDHRSRRPPRSGDLARALQGDGLRDLLDPRLR